MGGSKFIILTYIRKKQVTAKIGSVLSSGKSKSGVQYSHTMLTQANSEIVVVALGSDNLNRMKKFTKVWRVI